MSNTSSASTGAGGQSGTASQGATRRYMPMLRGKRAEWAALRDTPTSGAVVPLIDVIAPPPRRSALSGAAWAGEVVTQAAGAWTASPLFLDVRHTGLGDVGVGGTHFYDYVAGATSMGEQLVPVVGTADSAATYAAAAALAGRDGTGLLVRLTEAEVATTTADRGAALAGRLAHVHAATGIVPADTDLLVDVPVVSGAAVTQVNSLAAAVPLIADVAAYRSVTFAGSSAPAQSDVAKYGQYPAPRVEWEIWQGLRARPGAVRLLDFGDYGGFAAALPPGNGRTRHPALRYSHGDVVEIVRRQAAAGAGFAVFADVAAFVVAAPWYAGPRYSAGDALLEQIASGRANTGNAETWRRIALSHHIQLVLDQMSAHPGP